MEGRIADDGELLVRGPLVMRGYRGKPEATREAIDQQGWLHTGDLMSMDDAGFLTIIGRKKDIIINSSGKNMSPARIENALVAASTLIANVVVVGEGRPFTTALITLDGDAVTRSSSGEPDGGRVDPKNLRQLRADIVAGNETLSRVEQVKRFRILDGWVPGGEEITMTQKVKRGRVLKKFASLVDEMYADGPLPGVHEVMARRI